MMQNNQSPRDFSITEYARDIVRKKYKIKNPPIPIKEIAEREGINLFIGPRDDEYEARLIHTPPMPTELSINTRKSKTPRRTRFAIAHELGHFFLHPSKTGIFFLCRKEQITPFEWSTHTNPEESTANKFGVELLIPEFMVQRDLRNLQSGGMAAEYLSERYDVSKQMGTIRFCELCGRRLTFICCERSSGKIMWRTSSRSFPKSRKFNTLRHIPHLSFAANFLSNWEIPVNTRDERRLKAKSWIPEIRDDINVTERITIYPRSILICLEWS